MTDIREQAAKAARDYEKREVDAHPYMDPRFLHNEPWGKTFEIAYCLGHAAGVADGARAFAEVLIAEGNEGSTDEWFRTFVRKRCARFVHAIASRPAPGTGAQGKDEEGA